MWPFDTDQGGPSLKLYKSAPKRPIEVEMPDGTVAEFPSGTERSVIQGALQRHYGSPTPATANTPSLSQLTEGLRRADAAGNIEDAQRFATLINQQRAAGAEASVTPEDARRELARRELERRRQGAGPWTRYQSQPESGPWSKYAGSGEGWNIDQQRALALAGARRRRYEDQHGGNWWEAAPLVEQPSKNWWEDAPIVQPAPEQGGNGSVADYAAQVGGGLTEGITAALGAPVDLVNAGIVAPLLKGVNYAFGTDFKPSAAPFGGSAGMRRDLPIPPKSESTGAQMTRRIAQSLGGAAVPVAGGAKTVGQAVAGLGAAGLGGLGGAIANQVAPDNPWADLAGEVIGGVGGGAAIAKLASRSAQRAAERAVPTVQQLEQQAADKFDDAHRVGVTATQQQTQRLAADMRAIAQQEGLISPTGRVSSAYPKANEALRLVDDYAQGTMNVPQMQTVRKVLADAAKSTDAAERRMATIMLKKFDDFTSPLASQLAEGRALYTRAMRGEQLETLRELAEANRSKFSASGVENALRNEYRNLNRRIIKGKERGWTPEQAAAIRRIDEGTPLSNTMRNVGRMAPTGPISFTTSLAPAGIGILSGAPAAGLAVGAGVGAAGFAARNAATSMGMRNAEIAELLARNGGPITTNGSDAIKRRILEALLGAQAARSRD